MNPDSNIATHEALTLSELVHRHMSDPNHVITDEELRKVRLRLDYDDVDDKPSLTLGAED
jgi:hypothetical protein